MQITRTTEIMVGLFVAAGIVAIFFMAMQVSNLGGLNDKDGYNITARFENSGGLKVKSPVTVAGVRVGRVASIHFDKETYESVVEIMIASEFDTLPTDSSASIYTAGLLGEQYIGLEPGGDEEFLKNGDELQLTQSALVLEEIIGQFLFSKAEGE
jgi:phospholipid/cholesterol/gamma-HCH transport system substrate-binding protein